VLVGTVAYMSFEQFQGRPADAYSDQYAFCVSLYEAIHGVLPYAGNNAVKLFAAMALGNREPTPAWITIPRRLSRALWRGLSSDPAARWPSMQALIDELEALSKARRSRVVAGALGMVLAMGGGLGLTRETGDPCPDVGMALAAFQAWKDFSASLAVMAAESQPSRIAQIRPASAIWPGSS
jgi:hypothetical protein